MKSFRKTLQESRLKTHHLIRSWLQPKLEPVFAGFRTIQANKSIHRSTLTELTQEGQQLREELDSLIAIPRKSHQDSIHIVQSYNRLESIVKSLQNNDHP